MGTVKKANRLVLKLRHKGTRKWLITFVSEAFKQSYMIYNGSNLSFESGVVTHCIERIRVCIASSVNQFKC